VHYAYLFEAKGIQRYIMASGKLRDLTGASDLAAMLARSDGKYDLLGDVLQALGPEYRDLHFARRASAAFCVLGTSDQLQALRTLWRLTVMTALPGLEFTDGFGAGPEPLKAVADARKNSGLRLNSAADIAPIGGPANAWAPLTGRAAISAKTYTSASGTETVLLDSVTAPLRDRGDALQGQMDGVAARMLGTASPAETNMAYRFPRNLDPREGDDEKNPLFPYRSTSDFRIAVVHADLSGLGEAFREKGAAYTSPEELLSLATAIETAVLAAVNEATAECLLPHCGRNHAGLLVAPVRPIVIGGDDLTMIVRADLALAFTRRLLVLIEEKTTGGQIGGLSASAGIAFAHKGLPYLTGYGLADSLCSHAKAAAKSAVKGDAPWPSTISFHHQTQTAHEDYGRDILPLLRNAASGKVATANPYALDKRAASATGRPTIEQLLLLAQAIADTPGATNALREAKEDAISAPNAADVRWHRFRTYNSQEKRRGRLTRLDKALAGIGIASISNGSLPHLADSSTDPVAPWIASPLFDALVLIDLAAVTPSSGAALASEPQETMA